MNQIFTTHSQQYIQNEFSNIYDKDLLRCVLRESTKSILNTVYQATH